MTQTARRPGEAPRIDHPEQAATPNLPWWRRPISRRTALGALTLGGGVITAQATGMIDVTKPFRRGQPGGDGAPSGDPKSEGQPNHNGDPGDPELLRLFEEKVDSPQFRAAVSRLLGADLGREELDFGQTQAIKGAYSRTLTASGGRTYTTSIQPARQGSLELFADYLDAGYKEFVGFRDSPILDAVVFNPTETPGHPQYTAFIITPPDVGEVPSSLITSHVTGSIYGPNTYPNDSAESVALFEHNNRPAMDAFSTKPAP